MNEPAMGNEYATLPLSVPPCVVTPVWSFSPKLMHFIDKCIASGHAALHEFKLVSMPAMVGDGIRPLCNNV